MQGVSSVEGALFYLRHYNLQINFLEGFSYSENCICAIRQS